MNCGAKLPVFALLVGAFFAENEARVMLVITLIAWVGALLSAKLLRSTFIKGESTPFVMELPPYRLPTFRGLLIHTWERTWQYIKKAGTVILAISIVLFITDWLRVDIVALLVLVALIVTGLITPEEAFAGFSSPAVITVWAIFIVSGGLFYPGVANLLADRVPRGLCGANGEHVAGWGAADPGRIARADEEVPAGLLVGDACAGLQECRQGDRRVVHQALADTE